MDAPGGQEVAEAIRTLGLEEREERIYAEIARVGIANPPDQPGSLRRRRRLP